MSTWKRVIALCMALSLVIAASACGQSGSQPDSGAAESVAEEKDDAEKDAGAVAEAVEETAGDTEAAGTVETVDTAEAAKSGAAAEDTAAGMTSEAETAAGTAGTEHAAAADTSAAEIADPDRIDYANEENWAYFGIGEDKDVDLFLVCPTVDTKSEYNMSLDDEDLKRSFSGALNMERGIYEDSTRMFAPYYRQSSMKVFNLTVEEREPYLEFAYKDVSDAFAWYLENKNEGRPIVLAGFSQGSDMCYRLLEEYFGDEALYDQLVAVYAIGWSCTEEMVQKYPQIVPAKSADDLGVVVSFECEAEDITDTVVIPAGVKAYSINPLNWKTDGTPADKSENIGACFTNYKGEIKREVENLCGCYIDEERGALKVTDVTQADYPPVIPVMPEGSYHIYDYQFFYRNLQENVANRIKIYMENLLENAA